mgnify:CR=1 FL=1
MFPSNSKIPATFGALFAKVIDMTRLYILIIFDIKKIPRSIWNSSTHFRKKGKEPIRYVVVRQKYVIHPKNFWTSQNFPESNASALARYFSLCRGYPLPFFFGGGQKMLVCFFLYRCFNPHWSRDSVSPVCRIFFILYLRWKLVIFYSYVSIGKIIVLAFLHTLKIIHSWDKVVIKFTVSQPDSDFCHNKHRPTTPNALFMT